MKLFMFARIILLAFFTASLLLIALCTILVKNFNDVPSMMHFLKKAHTFEHVADIAKLQIKSYYPGLISGNFILRGLANQALDRIITPDVIEFGFEPALKLAVGFAKSPTSILDNKVVVQTAPYKTQAKQAIADIGLPRILVVNADFLIDNLPVSLAIVDLEKHPNSIFGYIIKARTFLQNTQKILSYSYVALIVSTFFIIVLHLHRLKMLFHELFIGLLLSGAILLVASYIIPGVVGLYLPAGGAIEQAQNALVMDALHVLLADLRVFSVIFLVLSGLLFAGMWFLPFEKLQKKFDKKLKKVHIPEVTVQVK